MDNNSNLGKWIVKNLLGAVVFFAALVILASVLLGVFTRHGKVIEVPDMTNMTVPEATELAAQTGIRVEVVDSLYVRKMQKGAIFKQNPTPGSLVKNGRRVMLTINTIVPKKVTMPDLVGLSLRQAKAELSTRGLNIGKLIYVEDIATNNVLRQIYRNREINAGRSVESGAEIDLMVGLNPEENQTYIPNVVGMKYLRAVDATHSNYLNVAKLSFDASVKDYSDSLDAVVYKQEPSSSMAPVLIGSELTLYLTVNEEKIPSK